jgi:hypothetical protein
MAESGGARSPRREATDPLWAQVLADLRRRLSEGESRHAFPGELAPDAIEHLHRLLIRSCRVENVGA